MRSCVVDSTKTGGKGIAVVEEELCSSGGAFQLCNIRTVSSLESFSTKIK